LPFVFAIATTEGLWAPLLVVLLYITVQFIEGNFITPKVLGNSVKLNALAAIMVVLLGSFFWGIAGIILAIPLLAMFRILLTHLEPLRPLALLLSDDLYDESDQFLGQYNSDRYRLSNIFSTKRKWKLFPKSAPKREESQQISHADTEVVADSKAYE
jgi:hypothetical protein